MYALSVKPDAKAKMAAKKKGQPSWMKGKKHSSDSLLKISRNNGSRVFTHSQEMDIITMHFVYGYSYKYIGKIYGKGFYLAVKIAVGDQKGCILLQ